MTSVRTAEVSAWATLGLQQASGVSRSHRASKVAQVKQQVKDASANACARPLPNVMYSNNVRKCLSRHMTRRCTEARLDTVDVCCIINWRIFYVKGQR